MFLIIFPLNSLSDGQLHDCVFRGLRLVDAPTQVIYIYTLSFQSLQEKIIMFVNKELKELQEDLRAESSRMSERQSHEAEVLGSEEAAQRQTDRENVLKITLSFLRQMNQDPLADALQSREHVLFVCASPGLW